MSRTQHIAVLCNYRLLPDRVGGMDQFFWRFDAACRSQEIAVDWFFPNLGDHGGYGELRIISAEGKSIEYSFLDHFQHKNGQYSHIITHFLELCTSFFKRLRKQTGARIIAVDHNPRPLDGYSFKKKVRKRLKGAIYSQYIDVFVGVSTYTVRELLRDFGSHIKSKCHVIHNGIIIENIEEGTTSNLPPRFVVVSHLRKTKGIQDLVEAVYLMPESIKKDLKIDIYGSGPFEQTLNQQIKVKKVQQNFIFKGSSSTILSVLSHYDYLLHPTHMECFSLTLLESLAANVPVITTPVGGNLEIVEDGVNGFIVPAKKPARLAACMEEVWIGTKKIQEGTRSKIKARFGIDKMVSAHLKLIS